MKIKSSFKPIVLVLAFALCLHIAAPFGFGAETRTCEQALDRCLLVASFMANPFYYAFCLEGYVFCKKYIQIY